MSAKSTPGTEAGMAALRGRRVSGKDKPSRAGVGGTHKIIGAASGKIAAPTPAVGRRRQSAAGGSGVFTISFGTRTEAVAAAVGGLGQVADLLEVSRSQPTRWKQGAEQPSPTAARLLLDLEHVMARAQLVFAPQVAREWLTGSNSYLDGARPIDVLRLRGSSEVIDALDAATQGAYS